MSSWLEWAADQGNAAMAALQEDLGEFVAVVSEDSAIVAQEATNIAAEKLGELGQQIGDLDAAEEGTSAGADDHEYFVQCRLQKLEIALRRDETTFLTDPAAAEDAMGYVEWLEEFDLEECSDESAELLNDNPDLLKLHIRIVPNQVSNDQFWTRYYWSLHRIHINEERRVALLEKVATEAEDVGWDDWEEEPADEAAPENACELAPEPDPTTSCNQDPAPQPATDVSMLKTSASSSWEDLPAQDSQPEASVAEADRAMPRSSTDSTLHSWDELNTDQEHLEKPEKPQLAPTDGQEPPSDGQATPESPVDGEDDWANWE